MFGCLKGNCGGSLAEAVDRIGDTELSGIVGISRGREVWKFESVMESTGESAESRGESAL